MPKRIRRSKDVSEWAHQIVADSVSDNTVSKVMAAMGRKGGKIGGKRRLKTMTPEQRREAAAHAARSRWAKASKAKD